MAIADRRGLRWAGALGEADLELPTGVTPAHRFPLGSVSKLVTATAAARLATRGAIDLDAPIARWLPGLPEHHHRTTLRQLMTHRGGIRHYRAGEIDMSAPGGAIYMRCYPTDAAILDLFIADSLVAEPGGEVSYSSYGYTLASMAMAAASGRPFLQLVEEEVAGPFGLPSLAPDNPFAIIPSRAGRYMNDLDIETLCAGLPGAARPGLADGWARLPFNNPAYCWAGAGFLMSPSDAARFGAAMIAPCGTPLTKDEHTLLFTPSTPATATSPALGLGWRIDSDGRRRRRWHHAGAAPGGCFLLAVYPDQALSVALAGNVMTMKMNMLQAAAGLIDIFAG